MYMLFTTWLLDIVFFLALKNTHIDFFTEPQAQVFMITCRSTISLSLLQFLTLRTFTAIQDHSSDWPRSCTPASFLRTLCTVLCDCCRTRECCSGTIHRTSTDWRDVSLPAINHIIINSNQFYIVAHSICACQRAENNIVWVHLGGMGTLKLSLCF